VAIDTGGHTYIAYISGQGTANPPPNIQATSGTVSIKWFDWGVDSVDDARSGILTTLQQYNNFPDFFGRYLDSTSGGVTGLTSAEASYLHAYGVKIILIDAAGPTPDGATSKGANEAARAVGKASALGAPPGTAIMLDVEQGTSTSSSFLTGWFSGVQGAGYKPGFYFNPYTFGVSTSFGSQFCATDTTVQQGSFLWTAEPSDVETGPSSAEPFHGTPPGAQSPSNSSGTCVSRASLAMWQYGVANTSHLAGNPNVDTDELQTMVGLW